jgi:hypothetical protein
MLTVTAIKQSANSLQPPSHAGSSLAEYFTLKMEAIHSSETSDHTICTRRHIPEDGILPYSRLPKYGSGRIYRCEGILGTNSLPSVRIKLPYQHIRKY